MKHFALSACFGPIAQWLEQRTHNPLVQGSSPCGPINLFVIYLTATTYINTKRCRFLPSSQLKIRLVRNRKHIELSGPFAGLWIRTALALRRTAERFKVLQSKRR